MILISLCFTQQKIDFRTAEEQAKDPNVALKKSLIFPGVGQLYNDQKIKGYTLIAAELFSLYSFNENRKKYKDYNESCLLYTSPSPRDLSTSRMPSSA